MSDRDHHYDYQYVRQIRGPDQEVYTEVYDQPMMAAYSYNLRLYRGAAELASSQVRVDESRQEGTFPAWYALPVSLKWRHEKVALHRGRPDLAKATPAGDNRVSILAYTSQGRAILQLRPDGRLALPAYRLGEQHDHIGTLIDLAEHVFGLLYEDDANFAPPVSFYDPEAGISHYVHRLKADYDTTVDAGGALDSLTRPDGHLGFLFLHREELQLFIDQNRATSAVGLFFGQHPERLPQPRPQRQAA